MSWDQFWDHIKEKRFHDAKADLRDYDKKFNAEPLITQTPTNTLLNIIQSNIEDQEYTNKAREEILRRCKGAEPPQFIPIIPKEEYISSRRKMCLALISISKHISSYKIQ
jgi:hypothetical protein